ncbi:hypothetical protein B0H10DRAFT_2227065 [Mycena sp. CBHHK59/15]|nr:hypothetical protein B0H10DRAFT_2227065 [Mycena sp. CBHHK59/15]
MTKKRRAEFSRNTREELLKRYNMTCWVCLDSLLSGEAAHLFPSAHSTGMMQVEEAMSLGMLDPKGEYDRRHIDNGTLQCSKCHQEYFTCKGKKVRVVLSPPMPVLEYIFRKISKPDASESSTDPVTRGPVELWEVWKMFCALEERNAPAFEVVYLHHHYSLIPLFYPIDKEWYEIPCFEPPLYTVDKGKFVQYHGGSGSVSGSVQQFRVFDYRKVQPRKEDTPKLRVISFALGAGPSNSTIEYWYLPVPCNIILYLFLHAVRDFDSALPEVELGKKIYKALEEIRVRRELRPALLQKAPSIRRVAEITPEIAGIKPVVTENANRTMWDPSISEGDWKTLRSPGLEKTEVSATIQAHTRMPNRPSLKPSASTTALRKTPRKAVCGNPSHPVLGHNQRYCSVCSIVKPSPSPSPFSGGSQSQESKRRAHSTVSSESGEEDEIISERSLAPLPALDLSSKLFGEDNDDLEEKVRLTPLGIDLGSSKSEADLCKVEQIDPTLPSPLPELVLPKFLDGEEDAPEAKPTPTVPRSSKSDEDLCKAKRVSDHTLGDGLFTITYTKKGAQFSDDNCPATALQDRSNFPDADETCFSRRDPVPPSETIAMNLGYHSFYMRIFIPPDFAHTASLFFAAPIKGRRFLQAKSPDAADIIVRALRADKEVLVIERQTKTILAAGHRRSRFKLDDGPTRLPAILHGIAHFNYFLENNYARAWLANITLSVHDQGGMCQTFDMSRDLSRRERLAEIFPEPDTAYQLMVSGDPDLEVDLFLYVFLFEPDTYTIQEIYVPESTRVPSLTAAGGTVTIGLSDDHGLGLVGLLKLFVTPEPLDGSEWIPQISPFDAQFEETAGVCASLVNDGVESVSALHIGEEVGEALGIVEDVLLVTVLSASGI